MPRLVAFTIVLLAGTLCRADGELHVRIDDLVAAKAGRAPELCDDAEFVRRVHLDFAGRIPSADETRQFLADTSADKRAKLIDRLLAGPEYPRRMHDAFQVMFLERLGEHPEWSKFLRLAFEKNKPWDQLVREILSPNPDDEATRGSAFFLTKRLENYGQNPVDLPALTRDVGRLFLGFDLQCAQCHDHLFVDDYKQEDFQGLFAFVSHTFIRNDLKFPAVGEKPVEKKTEFMSVFKKEPKATGPKLPRGAEQEIPTFAKGEEFAVPPGKGNPGTPKFSPLKILGEQLPRKDNPQFAKNAANRFWWLLLGRGLVHPLDLNHSANPPSHPELLDLLATEFAAHEFDVRWLLREISLSRAYQASGRVPDGPALKPELFVIALEKPLSAEQLLWSVLQATGELDRLRAAKPEAGDAVVPDDLRLRFVKAFANPPREPEVEFAPSVKAALFLMNDDVVLGWLKPQPGNLVDRVTKLPEPDGVADELYLAILSRLPAAEERAAVAAHLAANPDQRSEAVGQLAWSLLASTEFAMNH